MQKRVQCSRCDRLMDRKVPLTGNGKTITRCDVCEKLYKRCGWCGDEVLKEQLEEVLIIDSITNEEELTPCCRHCILDLELANSEREETENTKE